MINLEMKDDLHKMFDENGYVGNPLNWLKITGDICEIFAHFLEKHEKNDKVTIDILYNASNEIFNYLDLLRLEGITYE